MLKTKNMKLVCLMLMILFAVVMSMPAATDDVYGISSVSVANETELIEAITGAETETDIVLQNSISLTETLEIPEGKTINLSGKTGNEEITIHLASYESAQKSDTKAIFSVTGTVNVEKLIFNGNDNLRVIYIGPNGSVTLNDGAVVTGGNLGKESINWGAGIRLQGSRTKKANLIINEGAVIKDNTAAGDACITGIGVCIYRYGDVVMNGGKITGSQDLTNGSSRFFSYGGGIAQIGAGSTFTMNGGEISDCHAKAAGGGVYIATGTDSFVMNGGTIKNNCTTASGGGLYISGATAVMNDGNITGNKAESDTNHGHYATGGGVYIAGGSENDGSTSGSLGTFTMKGGTISGNTARTTASDNKYDAQFGQGGGVMVAGEFHMNGGLITGNSAASKYGLSGAAACGGGVSIKGGAYAGSFTMTGGEIKGNKAQNHGGGVFFNNQDLEENMLSSSLSSLVPTPGTGNFNLKGTLKIAGNLDTSGNPNNVYMCEDSYLTVLDELGDDSELYLECENAKAGRVVAKAGDDYTITAQDARKMQSDSGEKVYEVSKGEIIYTGIAKEAYIDISTAEVSKIDASYEYTGTNITPEPVVTLDGRILERGTDYTVSYKMSGYDNTNISTDEKKGIVKIIGAGNYEGTVAKTFNITARNISDVNFDDITTRIYTGSVIEPEVHGSLNGVVLSEGTDYTLDYVDNSAAGTGRVTVIGTGNFTGVVTIDFEIIKSDGLTLVSDEEELNSAISALTGTKASPEKIYVMKSFEADECIDIPKGKYIHVIGNGDDISIKAASSMKNLIDVSGSLTIESITLDGGQKGRVLLIEEDGYAGISNNTVITGGLFGIGTNDVNYSGGGIYNKGNLVLSAGEIHSNQARNGAAVFNTGNMTAGNVIMHDNTALMGGGAVYNKGEAVLAGGTVIINNTAEAPVANAVGITGAGGGVYNSGSLTCRDGCRIENNQADCYGGGIYTEGETVLAGGTVTGNITSGKKQTRVANCGGGVFVAAGEFKMEDGSITDNTAKSTYVAKSPDGSLGNGGGIFVSNDKNGASFIMNGGKVSGNKASSLIKSQYSGNGGGIFILGGDYHEDFDNEITPGNFTMNGGSITANSADSYGDGVFAGNEEVYLESKTSYGFDGAVNISMGGKIGIYDNGTEDVYLRENVVISLTGSISGSNIGITAKAGRTAVVTQGAGYELTEADADAFSNNTGRRTIKLNNANQIVLEANDIADVFSVKFEDKETSFTYTGEEIKPQVQVVSASGEMLKEGTDYSVSYMGSGSIGRKLINVGTKTAVVYGDGDYTGSIEISYEITTEDISKAEAVVSSQTYTGNSITPIPEYVTYNGMTLLRGTDYTLAYSDNVNAGTAKITVAGKGNFSGTKTLDFKISPCSLSKITISSISAKAYTGKALKPAPAVKNGAVKLVSGTDYTVAYKNNKNTGKATVTITGKGNYTGTKTVSFNIVPKKAAVSSAKSSKKAQLTVKCRKDTQASGYQIVIAKNKSFTSGKKTATLTKNTKLNKTFTKLTSKKTYYVKVRSYKTVSGVKCYGAYSTVKKIKIK